MTHLEMTDQLTKEGLKLSKRGVLLLMLAAGLTGCAPGAKVSESLSKSSRVAIVEFADCEEIVGNNCPGSGKIASKIYSDVFEGCPILSSEADPNVKKFDAVISGKILSYNIGTPLVGRVNYAKIDLQVKRPKDDKVVATQQDSNDASHCCPII